MKFSPRSPRASGFDASRAGALHQVEERLGSDRLDEGICEVGKAPRLERPGPWLRVDVSLRAGLEWGKGIPMPSPATWAKWSREALARLESIERLVSEDVLRESADGYHAILAWQGEPEVKATCNALGELRLESISVSAFQGIDLPRKWSDDEREPDEPPHEQLRAMFDRLKAALHAWGEVTDHLRTSAR